MTPSGTPPPVITSRHNPVIQQARALRRRKQRKETGLFWCEGPRVIEELLRSSWPVRHVLAAAGHPLVDALTPALRARSVPLHFIDPTLVDYLAETGTSQGIFAIGSQRLTIWPPTGGEAGPLIVLDSVTDPGNVGALVRIACALGGAGVCLGGDCADPFSPRALRASAGALFHLPVSRIPSHEEFARYVQEHRLPVFLAEAHGGVPPWEVDLSGTTAVVLGHETRGLHRLFESLASAKITIPLDPRVESLNVAAAGAAILAEANRQTLTTPGRPSNFYRTDC